MSRLDFDRFPEGAHIEDGLLIFGDEAWTPMDVARSIRARPDYATAYNRISVRRWRQRNPERAREIERRHTEQRRTGRPLGRPRKAA